MPNTSAHEKNAKSDVPPAPAGAVRPAEPPSAPFVMQPAGRTGDPGRAPASERPASTTALRREVTEVLRRARGIPGPQSEVGNIGWLIYEGLPEQLRPDTTEIDNYYRSVERTVLEGDRDDPALRWLDIEPDFNAATADSLEAGWLSGWHSAMAAVGSSCQPSLGPPVERAQPVGRQEVATDALRESLRSFAACLIAFVRQDVDEALELLERGEGAALMQMLWDFDGIRSDQMHDPAEHCAHLAHLARGYAWGDPAAYERCCDIGVQEQRWLRERS